MPLFNWGKMKRETGIADLAIRKSESLRDEFMRETEKAMQQAFINRESILLRIDTARKILETSRQELQLKEELYRENQVSNLDYLAALAALERYSALLHELQYQLQIVNVNIKSLAGKKEDS
jgi:outer membrane protein TolC